MFKLFKNFNKKDIGMIIISIVSMISTHFYGNLAKVKEPSKYVLEFNQIFK